MESLLAKPVKPLAIQRRSMAQPQKRRYLVHEQGGTIHAVEASTAAEAFEKSGVKVAIRILRDVPYLYPALEADKVIKNDEAVMTDPTPAEKKSETIRINEEAQQAHLEMCFEAMPLNDMHARKSKVHSMGLFLREVPIIPSIEPPTPLTKVVPPSALSASAHSAESDRPLTQDEVARLLGE